jgi:mono/diheme cytochrome c family protein
MTKGKRFNQGWLKNSDGLRRQRRSPLILLLLVLFWSLILGWGFAQASAPLPQQAQNSSSTSAAIAQLTPISTPDRLSGQQQLGKEIYLENCATCHIALPPEVLPSETWRQVLQDSQHYGQTIRPLVDPSRLLVWNYLQAFSRSRLEDEEIPYRMAESRYFKILHPRVKLPQSITFSSCASCHIGAAQYDFLSLTTEWENSP